MSTTLSASRGALLAIVIALLAAACSSGVASGTAEGAGQGIAVRVEPIIVTVQPSGVKDFSATVTGTADTRVTWGVAELDGGFVTTVGRYTAPAGLGVFHVVATSVADGTKVGSAEVTVAPPLSIDPTGLISADRVTLWDPGLHSVGGVPSASWAIYTTVSPSGGDDRAAIQSALNAAGAVASSSSPKVVKLAAGTFHLSGTVSVPASYVVLRGTASTTGKIGGGDGTKLVLNSDPNGFTAVTAGGYNPYNYTQSVNLAVDGPKDSQTVTLASWPFSPQLAVGELVLLDQVSDPTYNRWNPDRSPGGGPAADPSRGWFCRYDRPTGQIVEIASFNATAKTVTFSTPLHIRYKTANAAQLSRLAVDANGAPFHTLRYVGIEDLYIKVNVDASSAGAGQGNAGLSGVSYGWIKNVESDYNNGPALSLAATFRCEIRDSFVHSTQWPYPGGAGYGIVLHFHASDNLIENNISVMQNKVFVMRTTGGGNVVAYNYMDDGYIGNFMDWQEVGANASHMTTPMYEMFEGNDAFNFDADNTWGNAVYITSFRNHYSGIRRSGDPATRWSWVNNVYSGGSGAVPLTNVARRAAGLMEGHWWYSFVGNVLGTPGRADLDEYQTIGPPWAGNPAWKLGYNPDHWNNPTDSQVLSTVLRDGNWDSFTGQTTWVGGPKSLPNSFYLTAKPAFFGANPWPWVDPVGVPHLQTLPARARFEAAVAP